MIFNKKKRLQKQQKNQWEENLSDETSFWHSLAAKSNSKNPEWGENFHRRAATLHSFPDKFEDFLPADQKQIKVLDVGAGPITQLGSKHSWRVIEITPVDPLADDYKAILEQYGIQSVHPATIKGDGETLSSQFEEEEFDFIYSRNALDHSYDPIRAFQEIIKVLKTGGSFYLSSYINEGAGGNYAGLHQWNFDLADTSDDFLVWNKTVRESVKNALPSHVRIHAAADAEPGWMYAVITK